MNFQTAASLAALCITLGGCVAVAETAANTIAPLPAQANAQVTATITEQDVAWSKARGTNTIYGNAFVPASVTRYNVKTEYECSTSVALVPQSAYADQIMQFYYGAGDRGFLSWSGRVTQTPDGATPVYRRTSRLANDTRSLAGKRGTIGGIDNPIYQSSIRRSDCDQSGGYIFENIPDGEYYVVTNIISAPRWNLMHDELLVDVGGDLMRRVSVSNGERKRVILKP